MAALRGGGRVSRPLADAVQVRVGVLEGAVAGDTVTATTQLLGVGPHAWRVLCGRVEVVRSVHLLEDVGHAVLRLLLALLSLALILGQATLFVLLFKLLMLQEVLGHNARNFLKVVKHLLPRVGLSGVHTLAQMLGSGGTSRAEARPRLLLQETGVMGACSQEPSISIIHVKGLLRCRSAKLCQT